jgi:hypothetical protein
VILIGGGHNLPDCCPGQGDVRLALHRFVSGIDEIRMVRGKTAPIPEEPRLRLQSPVVHPFDVLGHDEVLEQSTKSDAFAVL